MRTTLDVDDRALAAARSRARTRGVSVGRALSDLALQGLDADASADTADRSGFPMLPPVDGHVITDDMVRDSLTDE